MININRYCNRFKDHVPARLANGWWKFAKPGTSIDMLCFQFFGGYWVVVGDLGDAIYHWNQKVNPEWIAGCNLDYVLSKCQASEVGRDFREWSSKKCVADIKEWWKEERARLEEAEPDSPRIDYRASRIEEAIRHAEDGKFEWNMYLYENGNHVFGDDWYEFAGNFGVKPHIRAILHLAALRVMVEKINNWGGYGR